MCRSLANGGRRCPSHKTSEYQSRESARRRLQHAKERQQPFSDTLYARHLEYVYTLAKQLINSNQTTAYFYASRDAENNLVWSEERSLQHQQVLEYFTSQWQNVLRESQAIVSGGLPGGGKTSTLENHAGITHDNFAVLSPDDVKEVMAAYDLCPQTPGFTPMESSALVYEEAVYLTNLLLEKATRERYNLIYDMSMSNHSVSVARLRPMLSAGYDIQAVFIDIEIATSLRRSQERHRKGLDRYLVEGTGCGGRLLPREAIISQQSSNPLVSSKNVEVFEALKRDGWFSSTMVFDNNLDGVAPRRIDL